MICISRAKARWAGRWVSDLSQGESAAFHSSSNIRAMDIMLIQIVLILGSLEKLAAFQHVSTHHRHRLKASSFQDRQIDVFRNTKLRVDHRGEGETSDSDANEADGGSSYQSSGSITKGIVSSLTSLTNSIFEDSSSSPAASTSRTTATSLQAPTSSEELMQRIRNDYTQNNYLWTGNLDTSAFVSNCTFTDPTLSFVGVDKFVENVGNLVPVVNYLLGDEQLSRSELLDIKLNDEEKYIETRWNMVGELNKLFWRPKIDVIGRTKFWYNDNEKGENVQVYFYDEMWEIPAGLALMQLVTKAGTISNTRELD